MSFSAHPRCPNRTINGQTGWRLPTKDELVSLYNSGAINGQGWFLDGRTWSSTPTPIGSEYYGVGLSNGIAGFLVPYFQSDIGYVSCVR